MCPTVKLGQIDCVGHNDMVVEQIFSSCRSKKTLRFSNSDIFPPQEEIHPERSEHTHFGSVCLYFAVSLSTQLLPFPKYHSAMVN